MKIGVPFFLLLLILSAAACAGTGQPATVAADVPTDSIKATGLVLPMDPAAHISAYVRRIFRDSKGRLWMGTNGDGVLMHDRKQLLQYSVDQGLAGSQVTAILEAPDGHIWFATSGGVSDFDGQHFRNYTSADGLPAGTVWSMLRDHKGTLWAGTESGVARLEDDGFVPLRLPVVSELAEDASTQDWVSCLAEDSLGRIWLGTRGRGAYIYDGQSFTQFSSRDGLCGDEVGCILFDRRGNTWFGTMQGGVCKYDGRTFKQFSQQNGAIGDNECWTVVEDKAGMIWFCSEGYGVYRYDGTALRNFGEAEGLGVRAVQSIYEDRDGRLLVGGGGGMYRFDGLRFTEVTRGGPWQ